MEIKMSVIVDKMWTNIKKVADRPLFLVLLDKTNKIIYNRIY